MRFVRNKLFRWGCAVFLSISLTAHAGAAWLLRAEDGFLTVRELESGETFLETGVPLAALPERDQPALKTGIVLPDHTALTKALEDFCS